MQSSEPRPLTGCEVTGQLTPEGCTSRLPRGSVVLPLCVPGLQGLKLGDCFSHLSCLLTNVLGSVEAFPDISHHVSMCFFVF